ncbi:MAG: hypothetical protein M3Z54_05235 [Gemmatimonadota bacterium]|nr:hypothetical protein [Gemmatimonadota bacterium]
MHKSKKCLIASAGFLAIALACSEVVGPAARIVQPTGRVANIAGPPDPQAYILSSAGLSSVELTGHNYRYPTWIVVKPNGPRFMLTAYPPALPASGSVGATGVSGGRNGCDFNAKVFFGQMAYGFGPCGAGAAWDTLLVQGQGFIRQGSFPLDFTSPDNSDCPPHTTGTCHVQELTDISFTVWPYPALMVPVTASPRAVAFNSVDYQQVTFTTGPNPAKIPIGGVLVTDTMTTTSWVYTAADGTLDGNMCSGGYPILVCRPYLHKSGRLVVKAWVGGWEQTSTITVQCLVGGEPALDDSLNDFRIRGDLLDVLVTSNADSSPSAGWTGQDWNRQLSRHESGGVIWRLANGGGYVFVPYEDPTSDAVHYHLADSAYAPSAAPIPGATPYAAVHDHPTKEDSVAYGWNSMAVMPDGGTTACSRHPGDMMADGYNPAPLCQKAPEDTLTWKGDGGDSAFVAHSRMPFFQITNGGFVWRLNYPQTNPATATRFRPSGGSVAQRKCAWVKKY